MYLDASQIRELGQLLKTFFTLPYSTDLDGKDAETLLRIIKGSNEPVSKRKELFDIVSGDIGYSVKTLRKSPNATRVDLQEQRFCDVKVLQGLAAGEGSDVAQGEVILSYMRSRIVEEMDQRDVSQARSLILLKWWDTRRENFTFRYWEEDFIGYIDDLWMRNEDGEVEWVSCLPAFTLEIGADKIAPARMSGCLECIISIIRYLRTTISPWMRTGLRSAQKP